MQDENEQIAVTVNIGINRVTLI